MGEVAVLGLNTRMGSTDSVTMPETRSRIMKQGLRALLVATQLAAAGLSVAQTNTRPTAIQQSPSIQANASPAAARTTGPTQPAIAVSPRSLSFAPVTVGETSNLAFTLKNVGVGTLTGAAKVSAPFSIVGGSPYVLGSGQSQVITVQYRPKASGLNVAVVLLTGGDGASITVAGSAIPAPAATPAPAPPQNLRLIAGR